MKNKQDSYDWFNPIDGEYTVIIEENENPDGSTSRHALDMKYGYMTYMDDWKEGSDVVNALRKNTPDTIENLFKVDTANTVWMPFYMNVPGVLLYLDPNGKDNDDTTKFKWVCQAAIPLSPQEHEEGLDDAVGTIMTPVTDDEGNIKYIPQTAGKVYVSANFDEFEVAFNEYIRVYKDLYFAPEDNSEEE